MTFAMANRVHFRVMFRPELVNLGNFPAVRARANRAFQQLVAAVASCHPEVASSDPRLVQIANALWAGAHGVAVLWLDGPVRRLSPGESIGSLIDLASEMFSEAGATVSIERARAARRK